MSDKAERVAEQFPDIMLKWYATPGVAMEGEWKKRAIKEIAAIIREEYPDEPTLDQLAKSQGVEPIEDMGTLVIPGLEDDPPIDHAPDVSALREVSPGVWLTESRHAAECLWRDLPLKEDGTFRSTTSSLDTIEKHMVAFLEGHRPDHDVSALREALDEARMTFGGIAAANWREWEDGSMAGFVDWAKSRSLHGIQRIEAALLRSEPQPAPDVSALREALEGLYKIIMDEGARGVDDTIDKRSMIATAAALLRSEPKLGGTV
jgi:hypothetical protein